MTLSVLSGALPELKLEYERTVGVANTDMIDIMEKCPQCMKILFRKKTGGLACPNGCDHSTKRRAFNTVIDPMKDRRIKAEFDPWDHVKS